MSEAGPALDRRSAKAAWDKFVSTGTATKAAASLIRVGLDEYLQYFSRKYLGPAREELKKMYMHKNINVLGSANQA